MPVVNTCLVARDSPRRACRVSMVTMHIAVVCVGLRGLIVVVRRIGALSRGGGFSVAVLAAHARHPVGKNWHVAVSWSA